jgi:pimeloyl-ACP methyl ester carboxylesterase
MRTPIIIAGLTALAAGAFVALRRQGLKEDRDWRDVDRPGRIVEIDGYGVHVVERGAGPAMLLLHGFGGQTYSYRHQIEWFSRSHRVVAVDLKGYGYSERHRDTDLSRDGQVAMLKALLHELGIDRTTLVGHSMGGGIAQRFAAAHPGEVDVLILVASAGEQPERFRRRLPTRVIRPLLPVIARVAADRLWRASWYDPARAREEDHREYMRPARLKGSMDGLMSMMNASTTDAPIDYGRITMPVLLLSGAGDRVVPLSRAQELRERMPQARLVVVDKAGHLLLEERPEECNRAIDDFLRESAPDRHASMRAGAP